MREIYKYFLEKLSTIFQEEYGNSQMIWQKAEIFGDDYVTTEKKLDK